MFLKVSSCIGFSSEKFHELVYFKRKKRVVETHGKVKGIPTDGERRRSEKHKSRKVTRVGKVRFKDALDDPKSLITSTIFVTFGHDVSNGRTYAM